MRCLAFLSILHGAFLLAQMCESVKFCRAHLAFPQPVLDEARLAYKWLIRMENYGNGRISRKLSMRPAGAAVRWLAISTL